MIVFYSERKQTEHNHVYLHSRNVEFLVAFDLNKMMQCEKCFLLGQFGTFISKYDHKIPLVTECIEVPKYTVHCLKAQILAVFISIGERLDKWSAKTYKSE